MPGVIAVLTAADLEGRARPIRALNSTPGYQECDTPMLASRKVRMVGEPVALVVAESSYAAEDGAGAVQVSYGPLRALVEIEDALAEGAPAIHDEIPDNLFNSFEASTDDFEEAFADADEVIELELRQQRYGAAPMEGRAVIADAGRRLRPGRVALEPGPPHRPHGPREVPRRCRRPPSG